MNTNVAQYVNVPNFLKIKDNNLQYLDALAYASLRSFDNPDEDCFPMHETVGKRAGLSKNFIIDSIKRLEAAKLITVDRSEKGRVSNQYYFVKKHGWLFIGTEKVPVTLFNANDLTVNEKAMMICLRQFFNHGRLTSTYSVTFFAKFLGLTYATVKKQFDSLLAKGYINEKQIIRKGVQKSKVRYYFSDKINWDYYDLFKKDPEKKIILYLE